MDEKLYTLPDKLREIINQFPDKIVMQMKKEDGYLRYTYIAVTSFLSVYGYFNCTSVLLPIH